ncbi:MAG: aldo/keto reductase family protein [Microcystaceae cyanobacterium]
MNSIGLGTYRLGKKTYAACLMALEMGYRHLDTAALYNNEEAVFRAVKASAIPREQIFITSKVPLKAIQKGQIKEAARRSLEQLGFIDLLLLHAPGADPLSAWEEMLEVKSWPEIGEIGVSNFNLEHLQSLVGYPPKWNQIEISPFLQRRKLVRYCQAHQIQIIAHSSLIKGRKMNCSQLLAIANQYHYTPAQLLLAWSLDKGYKIIPRSSQKEHLQENLMVKKIVLLPEIIQQLDKLEKGYMTHPQHR